jgi:hypothetical protein
MNPRSIRFRLAAYQVLLLAGVLLAFSLAAFWGFRRHLTHLVEAQCANLTRQIAESLLANIRVSGVDYLRDEVQEHYDPETNNLFVRIVQPNGTVVYESGEPHDRSFSPPQMSFLPNLKESHVEIDAANGRLVFIRPYSVPQGESYQIQMAASLQPVQTSLQGLRRVEVLLFPFALLISAGGSALLVSRSLNPIRHVIATARQINSGNLRQRLVETPSGDEIQELRIIASRRRLLKRPTTRTSFSPSGSKRSQEKGIKVRASYGDFVMPITITSCEPTRSKTTSCSTRFRTESESL